MIAASTSRIRVAHASHPVFADLTCEVHDDRVAGLIGPNGCGKTTLLRVFAGEIAPSEGTVSRRSELSIGYLRQDVALDPEATVYEAARGESIELAEVDKSRRAWPIRPSTRTRRRSNGPSPSRRSFSTASIVWAAPGSMLASVRSSTPSASVMATCTARSGSSPAASGSSSGSPRRPSVGRTSSSSTNRTITSIWTGSDTWSGSFATTPGASSSSRTTGISSISSSTRSSNWREASFSGSPGTTPSTLSKRKSCAHSRSTATPISRRRSDGSSSRRNA